MKFAQDVRVLWGQKVGDHLQENPWFHTLGNREKNALPLLQHQHSPKASMIRDLSQSIARANSITWQEDEKRHVGPTLLSRQTLWAEPTSNSDFEARLLLGREALRFQGFPIATFLAVLADYSRWKETSSGGQSEQSRGHGDQRENCSKGSGTQSGKKYVVASRTWSGFEQPLPLGFPSEALMWDLAGNGMALPVLMAIVQSALSCLPWRAGETAAPLAEQDDVRVACEAVGMLDTETAVVVPASSAAAAPVGLFKKRRLRQ